MTTMFDKNNHFLILVCQQILIPDEIIEYLQDNNILFDIRFAYFPKFFQRFCYNNYDGIIMLGSNNSNKKLNNETLSFLNNTSKSKKIIVYNTRVMNFKRVNNIEAIIKWIQTISIKDSSKNKCMEILSDPSPSEFILNINIVSNHLLNEMYFKKNEKCLTLYKLHRKHGITNKNNNQHDHKMKALQCYNRIRNESCPKTSTSLPLILSQLFNNIKMDRNVSNKGSFSQLHGCSLFESNLASFIAATLRRSPSIISTSPSFAGIHDAVISWMIKWFGYQINNINQANGVITSGGSLSNFTAINCAKEWKLNQLNQLKYKDNNTYSNVSKLTLYVSYSAHFSIIKAAKMLLVDEDINIRKIHVNKMDGTINVLHLENTIVNDIKNGFIPFIICSTAGTTGFGTIDNIVEINKIKNKYNIWHHCDCAYGGGFILTNSGKTLMNDISNTDSLSLCCHKSLFMCPTSSCLLVKNGKNLLKPNIKFANNASYLQWNDLSYLNIYNRSIELTRMSRGFTVWFPLKIHGINKFKNTLNNMLYLTKYFANNLINDYYSRYIEIKTKPILSIFTFGFQNLWNNLKLQDKFNAILMDEINLNGTIGISSYNGSGHNISKQYGNFVLRVCIVNYKTDKNIINTAINIIHQSIDKVLRNKCVSRL